MLHYRILNEKLNTNYSGINTFSWHFSSSNWKWFYSSGNKTLIFFHQHFQAKIAVLNVWTQKHNLLNHIYVIINQSYLNQIMYRFQWRHIFFPRLYLHSLFSSLFQYKDSVPAPKSQISKTLFESSWRQQMLRLLIYFTFSISVVFSSVLLYPNPSPLQAHQQSMKQKKSFASFKMRGEGMNIFGIKYLSNKVLSCYLLQSNAPLSPEMFF